MRRDRPLPGSARTGWLLTGAVAVAVAALWHCAGPEAPTARHTAAQSGGTAAVSAGASAAAASASAIPSAAAPIARSPGPGEAEVCGLGFVQVDPDDPAGERLLDIPLRRRAVERLTARLQAATDERSQAVGWLLALRGVDPTLTLGPPLPAAQAAARDALARLAARSQDPAVYAFAIDACLNGTRAALGGACQLLSFERWTQLDPSNTYPWLALLERAHAERDTATADEALFRASRATRSDLGYGLVLQQALRAAESLQPLAERTAALAAVQSLASVIPMVGMSGASQACAESSMADANRRQTCEQLAERMVEAGRTLLDLVIGVGIGARAGWPAERVQALRDEAGALQIAIGDAFPAPDLSCAAQARRQAWAEAVAREGERAAARGLLRQQGRSLDAAAAVARRERSAPPR